MANIFDEVKLVKTLPFSGRHILEYAENAAHGNDNEVPVLFVEVVCDFGSPCYILRIFPAKNERPLN